ncbi:MAG: hypothetical protein OHK0048_12400 [Rhodoferax sp.]
MNTEHPKGFLAGCEAEALHLSGAIQAHGAMVVSRNDQITHVSQNLLDWLKPDMQLAPGQALPPMLQELAVQVDAAPGSRRRWCAAWDGPRGALDLVAIRAPDECLIWELWPASSSQRMDQEPSLSRESVSLGRAAPENAAELELLRSRLVNAVARLSGHARVMYYLFREDGDGEVVAEARLDESVYGSYLGLRFPASDIPMVARNLYLRNPWRLIPDAQAPAVPLVGLGNTPPDLTPSDLRSVSPVHLIYLANMGVRASLSLPISVGGQLVALVAAHHPQPRMLPLDTLEILARWARSHSLALTSYQSAQRMRLIDGLDRRFEPVRQMLGSHTEWAEIWPQWGPWLMQQWDVDGVSLCIDDACVSVGVALDGDALHQVDDWFCHHQSDSVWFCDSLTRTLPVLPLTPVAGVLALRVSIHTGQRLRLYLCRSEYIHSVTWGGQPNKPVEQLSNAVSIAPRRSFERWIEKRLGYCRGWDHEARLLALRLRELLVRSL